MVPDFLICLACESPCYTFEWKDGKITEALCQVCGNEDTDQFLTEEGVEELEAEG